ncbi:MAG: arginine--tRNA ligase [Bacteroidetes bacterium]|nr:arginine--tRNA ligase [Bacteroidota bacterium]
MTEYLTSVLRPILADLGAPDDFVPAFETPGNPEHGDLATNAALQLAKPLRRAPRQIADAIAAKLRETADPDRIAAVEVAGPGFLNIRFSDRYLAAALRDLRSHGDGYGRTDAHAGQTALVEFVSANPTGPLTVGHGRNAVLGDTVASLLEAVGYAVTREYYFNDAGRQMRILGQSVRARYDALVDPAMPTKDVSGNLVPETFPDDGYLGGYIEDIARSLYDAHGDALAASDDETPFKQAAQAAIFQDIEGTMRRLGVEMDTYFNEHTLYQQPDTGEKAPIYQVVDTLNERGYIAERDGAVWLLTSKTGKVGKDGEPVDTVLVKSSGEPTYRLPDIAYHVNKLNRGFDLALDVFGADHIATYPDVLLGLDLLGYDSKKVDVLVYQFVTLVRGGEQVKMSTRKANYVTLDELMDDVGVDVTRYFFLMRSPGTHLEFDLDLAKEASDKNPVFYLQYAHARICSILRKAEETGLVLSSDADLSLLTHPSEIDLTKALLHFPQTVARAAEQREPHLVAGYLREVASAFSQVYRDSRIVGEEKNLAEARLALADATRIVLGNGLRLLGLNAPEKM